MAPSKNYIWVVLRKTADLDEFVPQVAFTDEQSAKNEAAALTERFGEVYYSYAEKIELKEGKPSASSNPKAGGSKAKTSASAAASTDKAPPTKPGTSAASNARKEIPPGKANSLEGLKLLFTGTFNAMDRETSKATAEKYGATVLNVSKISETDYVILGTKAGAKKLEEIEAEGLETLDEAEFLKLLQIGVSAEKRERMAAKASEQPAKKKQKK